MTVDRKHIGYKLPPFTVTVSAERLRRFAVAIGEPGAGSECCVAPLTYLKVIEGEGNSSREIIAALGIDLRRVMHVEQEFEYGVPVRGGDQVTVERVVSDIYDRKGGALEFVVVDSTMHNSTGAFVGRSRQSILVRNALQLEPA
jgi:hypothetical protein